MLLKEYLDQQERGALRELAARIGVKYQTIQKWVARERLPRSDVIGATRYAAAISEATGLDEQAMLEEARESWLKALEAA